MNERELHERASALFMELRGAASGERERRLGELDAALRREVSSLLEHDAGGEGEAEAQNPDAEGGATRIGPYRVIGRIGRGGSGFVLLAEQDEPVRRRVAIKLVPHAAVNPEIAARFEFERRALERTEHPNIARILDAGRTGEGVPYLVMEYVEGVPIAEYCRARGLPLRERIGLFLQVADAVQHAHQRGVIHRDLKPANILVADVSRAGEGAPGARTGAPPGPLVKVLDFGIAKATGEWSADTPRTVGTPLGTPSYMAPEQSGGVPEGAGGRAVDTRADVYALGAVMYELACGKPPVDARGDAMEVIRRIREAVPAPAGRVRAQDAEFGRDAAPKLAMADLDCVLAKALEKDPGRRYSTVGALAEDLKRVLRREPIEARPATLRYRAARFAQRNRLLVASVAAVGLAVMVGIVGLTAGLIEAKRQKREADTQSQERGEINRFLTDDLLAAASPDQEGQNITALDLLRRASRRVDERLGDRPLIAATVHHTLGVAFTELGAFDDAQRHLDKAIALRRAGAGADAPDTLHSEIAAASLLGHREKWAEAEAALTEVIGRARSVLGPDDGALYSAINDLGVVYEGMDKGKEAVAMLTEALAGRSRLLGAHDPQVLETTSNLAQAYDRTGQTQRSLELMIEALKIADSLPETPLMTIIGLSNNIGATYQDLNRDKEAVPYLRRASELAAQRLGPENPATLSIQGNLAGLEAEHGDAARAAELYDAVVKARVKVMGPDAEATLTARYGYWNALWHGKRFDEAAAGYQALLPDIERALGEKHWLATQTRSALARALCNAGRLGEALPYAQRATEEFMALYGPDHPRTKNAAGLLGEIEGKIGKAQEATR
jgi:eukaryotic-like serine/threonine-protein kinase